MNNDDDDNNNNSNNNNNNNYNYLRAVAKLGDIFAAQCRFQLFSPVLFDVESSAIVEISSRELPKNYRWNEKGMDGLTNPFSLSLSFSLSLLFSFLS